MKKHHPDRGGDPNRFREVKDAYDQLRHFEGAQTGGRMELSDGIGDWEQLVVGELPTIVVPAHRARSRMLDISIWDSLAIYSQSRYEQVVPMGQQIELKGRGYATHPVRLRAMLSFTAPPTVLINMNWTGTTATGFTSDGLWS